MKLTIASLIVSVVGSACVLEASDGEAERQGEADQAITINPPPPDPGPIQVGIPCGSITSFSPASAQPGDVVDIYLPFTAHPFYTIVGASFAPGAPASFTVVDYRHLRATVPMAAAPGHVKVTCHNALVNHDSTIESTTDFTPLAIGVASTPASAMIDYSASTSLTLTLGRPAPQPFSLTLTPTAGLALNASGTGVPIALSFSTGQLGAIVTATGINHGAQSIAVTAPNIAPLSIPITVVRPSFTLSAAPAAADVHWGGTASYTVTVRGSHNLSGNVALSASGLPTGASAAPVTVSVPLNGTATATFVVATTTAATALGTDSFTLNASHSVAASQSSSLSVRVLPSEGAFSSLTWRTATSTCGAMTATVSLAGTVRFSGPSFMGNGIPFLSYAFAPNCRSAVVFGSGPSVQLYNLGFPSTIAGTPGMQVTNFGGGAYDNTRFQMSSDDSYIVVIADIAGGNRVANLYSMLDGTHVNPSHQFSDTLSVHLVGDQVQATPSITNAFNWTVP